MIRKGSAVLVLLTGLSLGAVRGQDTEAFFDAARTGDLEGIRSWLARGMDVNARWRYDTTALMMACRRGHTEVVKLLLEKGADVRVKDSFYGMSPLTSAASEGHIEIVAMLLSRGAPGADEVLLGGVNRNSLKMVEAVLTSGKVGSETLSRGLTRALRNNRTEIAEALRRAGAVPAPEPDFQVDEATLRRYEGVYRNEREMEIRLKVEEGKLVGGPPGQSLRLGAFDRTTFQPLQEDEVLITFELEGEKVAGFVLKQGQTTSYYRRVEGK